MLRDDALVTQAADHLEAVDIRQQPVDRHHRVLACPGKRHRIGAVRGQIDQEPPVRRQSSSCF
jgi:hypothetical protein